MIRAFISVELPEPLRQEVAVLQSDLRSAGADVKWVESDNLHLTLKFLGDIEESQVAPLREALACALHPSTPFALSPVEGQTSLRTGPFTIQLEGIGAFPRTTSPRVVWVGVNQGKTELETLAQKVETACEKLGFPAEERPFDSVRPEPSRRTNVAQDRPFSAHLTIGRVRSRDGLARLIKKLQVAEFRASTPAPVDRLILFQSTLSPKGPIYTPLAEIPLG